ncbi:hypothetical protein EV359DRAFT_66962 [Lentinula novae-zelandiae]|nr:hypothetical protein EV359DRAFT_66962 [Lentinula novae-zelandiae]
MANYAHSARLNIIENGQISTFRDYEIHHNTSETPNYYIICDLCNAKKGTTINGNLNSFRAHRGSKRCDTARRRKEQREKEAEKEEMDRQRELILHPPQTPPLGHRTPPVPLRPHTTTVGHAPICSENDTFVFGAHPRTDSIYDSSESETVSSQSSSFDATEISPDLFDEFVDLDDATSIDPNICRGLVVPWRVGLVRRTYPLELHSGKKQPPWDIIGWHTCEDGQEVIQVKSVACSVHLRPGNERDQGVCLRCIAVPESSQFHKIEERAARTELSQHMPVQYLTHEQLLHVARTVQSLEKQLENSWRRNTQYKQIMTFLAEYDVSGLRRLIATSLRRGASPSFVFRRLEDCINQMYSPRGNFSRRDYDIAFIAKSLGGPRLLYALQKAFGLPSRTALSKNAHVPELRPCISKPSEEEIDYNISTLFDSNVQKAPMSDSLKHAGKVLMMDGIAVEEVCRYCPARDKACGLCREHGNTVDCSVPDYAAIKAIEEALEVLISSCKKEDADQLSRWLQLFLEVWRSHPNVLASDGESTFRSARFKIAMSERIDTTQGFGVSLSDLPGLNLQTGFVTLTRSLVGIQIDDTTITSVQIAAEIAKLEGVGATKAADLMDPHDKQNVPKATALLTTLAQVEPISEVATEAERQRKIAFLGHTLNYFFLAFTSAKMSLSDQIFHLTTYAHLTYAMYKRNGLGFLTSALYADSHSVIKQIICTIAHLQAINPELLYLLLLDGTNRLEGLFSNVRTQDHSRNFDILQLAQKLSIAAELVAVFSRHPELDHGHRRRNLTDIEGIDHINPASVPHENKKVGQVNLSKEWRRGMEEANKVLICELGQSYDFLADFMSVDRDMMRPDGEYIGSRWMPGDEKSEDEDKSAPSHDASIPQSTSTSTSQPIPSTIPIPSESDQLRALTQSLDEQVHLTGLEEGVDSSPSELPQKNSLTIEVEALRIQSSRFEMPTITGDGPDDCVLQSGDLAATVVVARGRVPLAVVEILHFEHWGTNKQIFDINVEQISTEMFAVCQVVKLTPYTDPNEDGDRTVPSVWLWECGYHPVKENSKSQKDYSFNVPTSMLNILVHDLIANPFQTTSEDIVMSRAFDHADLEDTFAFAYDMLDPNTDSFWETVALLPQIQHPSFSYLDTEDSSSSLPILQTIDPKVKVPFNPLVVKFQQYVGEDPCGWCGLDGCRTVLTKKGKKQSTASDCEYHHARMSFSSARSSSAASPSTNIPIHCTLCKPHPTTVWKYNILSHLISEHAYLKPLESGVHLPSLPNDMWLDMYICYQEESAMVRRTAKEGISQTDVNAI